MLVSACPLLSVSLSVSIGAACGIRCPDRLQERPDNLAVRSSSFCFATCVCLSACDSGRLVELLLRNVCLSVCMRLGSTRRAFASQRVSVRLPATRVDSSSFCFATCVCLSACDTVRALWLRPKIDTQRLQNRPSEGPKSSQDRPGTSRSGPERPKSVPRASQERPRGSQERHKSAQEGPRRLQEASGAPKSDPRASENASEEAFGSDLALKSQKP